MRIMPPSGSRQVATLLARAFHGDDTKSSSQPPTDARTVIARLARPLLALLFIPIIFAGPCGRMVGFAVAPAPSAVPADSLLRAAANFAIQFAEQSGLEIWDGAPEISDRTWDACAGGPREPLTLCWRISESRVEFQTIEWSSGGRKGKLIRHALIDSLRTRFGEMTIVSCEWSVTTGRDALGQRRDTAICIP